MLKVGDRVEYWYRMGRVGTVIGIKTDAHNTMMEGGTLAGRVMFVVRFDDGKEELYPSGELRLSDG
tara:strand:+ start:238 stop:435 length:198 start_codon:yes stop_codon:yes gene_type:complete